MDNRLENNVVYIESKRRIDQVEIYSQIVKELDDRKEDATNPLHKEVYMDLIKHCNLKISSLKWSPFTRISENQK